MARMRPRLQAPGADRRRRGVRLPRRARPAGARRGCSATAWSGCSGSRRSRAGCGSATRATTRCFVVGLRAPVRPSPGAAASLKHHFMRYDVSVIGLGRIGLPLALSFADSGLSVLGVDTDQDRLQAIRERRMPFKEPGTDELIARVDAGLHQPRRGRRPGRRDRAHARHARAVAHRDRHPRHPHGARRPAAAPARGSPDRAALDGRARHDRVRRRLPREAARLPRRRGHLRRARARADRRRPLHGGDRHAAVHRRRRRRGLRRARGAAVRAARRADRPDHAGAGRAGEDLDQHPALRDVRAAEPADDGLRAPRRERLRRHRAHQPRLSARRDGAAGPDRRHVPAQGLRVLRGALERARHAARGLARARDRAAVPRRRRQAPARRQPARAQGGRARAELQGRHRRRARFAVAQADPAARARAGRRRRARPDRRHADEPASRRR